MPNPINVLNGLQTELNKGLQVNNCIYDPNYKMRLDKFESGNRFVFMKIINGVIQTLSIFGTIEPIKNLPCFSIGYAVLEQYRGKGLALEAMLKGIEEVKFGLGGLGFQKFYIEAVIDRTNIHSINVAEKLFSCKGKPVVDSETNTPAYWYLKLIEI